MKINLRFSLYTLKKKMDQVHLDSIFYKVQKCKESIKNKKEFIHSLKYQLEIEQDKLVQLKNYETILQNQCNKKLYGKNLV